MPALSNPRYERFAQALFAGLAGETRIKRAQSTAYLAAYPNCSKGNPAEAAASRLLRRVKPIADRVRKLMQSVGLREPDDDCIQAAIEANDAFIARLEAIFDGAQAPKI